MSQVLRNFSNSFDEHGVSAYTACNIYVVLRFVNTV